MTHLAINGVFLCPGRTGGAETYTRALLREYGRQPPADRVSLLLPTPTGSCSTDSMEIVSCPVDARRHKARILWEQFTLPRYLARLVPDLVHFPYGTMPQRYHRPCVVTIHDTMRFVYPRQLSLLERRYKQWIEHYIASQPTCHVICVSQTDADIFATYAGMDENRVHTVYHGVDEHLLEAGTMQPAAACEQDYMLWLGRPYPQKNLETLLHAVKALCRQTADVPRLRVVGLTDRQRRRYGKLCDVLGIGTMIDLEPGVPRDALTNLLRGALLLCCPSKYESFGLPVLEAMACGVPVVCADLPVFRELHDGVAYFTDPDSPQQMAGVIREVLVSPARRREMRQRGITHAAQFTWQRCARQTRAVYKRALG